MPDAHCFFVDDSGTRHPDRQRGHTGGSGGHFGLGGLIIRESDIPVAEQLIAKFRSAWPELGGTPLHSYEIRNKTKAFAWLTQVNSAKQYAFMQGLSELIASLPMHVTACVVDRDGYNARYMTPYGARRWRLCKTAFAILMERAVKYARWHGTKLRVYVERSDKRTDNQMKAYYDSLRADGLPFDSQRSALYQPLSAADLHATLYEFRLKDKSSHLMQIADLVLWPLCRHGYHNDLKPYLLLRDSGKLVEALSTAENSLLGTKYSCFENVIKT